MAQVLVVDDDMDIRALVRLILEDDGHSVLEAADGEAALAVLRATSDRLVVLLDHLMPKLTGLDLLSVVAGNADLARDHAYMLLPARPDLSAAHLAAWDGHLQVAILTTPFDLEELLAAVDKAARRLAD